MIANPSPPVCRSKRSGNLFNEFVGAKSRKAVAKEWTNDAVAVYSAFVATMVKIDVYYSALRVCECLSFIFYSIGTLVLALNWFLTCLETFHK